MRAVAEQATQRLKVYHNDSLSEAQKKELLQRPRVDFSSILDTVCAALATSMRYMLLAWAGCMCSIQP